MASTILFIGLIEDFTFMVVLISIAATAAMIPAARLGPVAACYRKLAGHGTPAPACAIAP